MDQTATDGELIRRIVQQDEAALGELYERYSRLVYSVAYHMVGSRALAEEITLDVFTRVWQKAHTYRPERAQVSTWLTSMSRYRAIDELRREGVRPEKDSVAWAEVNREPQSGHNPESAASLHLQQQRVRRAINQLPESQRKALALAYFGGQTHREIADTLQEPLGTVKTRIRSAMKKLRFLLREEDSI